MGDEVKKEDITSDAPVQGLTVKPNPNDPVTLTRGQLEGILAQIDELKTKGEYKKPKRVTERIATLRFHNSQPVVWYGNVKEVKEKETGNKVAYMDIQLFDGTKETVEYLAFLNSPNSVQVQIKSQKAEKVEQNLGTFIPENPHPARDPNTGRPLGSKNWNPVETEAIVESYKYTATVVVNEGEHTGKEFVLPSSCLNQ